jgi:putative Mn2+ efflux pump MntP
MNSLIQIVIIALGLSMDALSVSVAIGTKTQRRSIGEATRISLFFGGFQAAMPLIGFVIGNSLRDHLGDSAKWIAAALLIIVAIKMIKDAMSDNEKNDKILTLSVLTVLGIATSIDALVIGTTIGLTHLPIFMSVILIGCITFVLCILGYLLGNILRKLGGDKFEYVGAIALIIIAVKILL